jgi:hypothetical protein
VVVVVRLVAVPCLLVFRVVLDACVVSTRWLFGSCPMPFPLLLLHTVIFELRPFLLLFHLSLLLHLGPLLDLVHLVVAASLAQIQALLVCYSVVV